jgi:HEAT repeat protein
MASLGTPRRSAPAAVLAAALVLCVSVTLCGGARAQFDAQFGAQFGAPLDANPPELVSLLQDHYRAVVAELRAADMSRLRPEQCEARARVIAELAAYCERGDFGVNRDYPGARVPYFVDAAGRRCAVANLLDKTGCETLVTSVARRQNHAYVAELADDPALAAWLERVGLTLEEAVRIQLPMSHPKPAPPESEPGKVMVKGLKGIPGGTSHGAGASTSPSGSSGASTPPSGARETGSRTGASTAGSGVGGGPTFTSLGDEGWFHWWEMNKLRFLAPNRLREARGESRYYTFRNTHARMTAERARAELLPALVELVRADDALLRARAAVALGRIGGAEAVEDLSPLLADDALVVRHAALLALGATGALQAAPLLLHVAEHGTLPERPEARISHWARPIAILALGIGRRHGLPDVVDGFVTDLAERTTAAGGTASDDVATAAMLYHTLSPNADVGNWAATLIDDEGRGASARCRAAETLRSTDDPSLLPLLTRALGGTDLELRRSAALGMGGLAHPLVRAELQTAFELEDEPVARGFILIALAEQGGPQAAAFLAQVARKGKTLDRPWAALALGLHARTSGDEAALAVLREGLATERNRSVKGAFMLAAGLARDGGSADHLRKAVDGASDPRDRMFAALALGMIGDEQARPLLAARLQRETAPIAIVGLSQALGAYGDESDAPALLAAVRGVDQPELQALLSVAMGFHGTEGALTGLLEIARDARGKPAARAAAVDALGLMLDPSAGLVLADVSSDANFYAFPSWVDGVLTTFTL